MCSQVIKGELSVFLECTSSGNPYPSFTWWTNIENAEDVESDQEVTSQLDSRYTLSSGRFTIEDPENKDIGYYRCMAINDHGIVLSRMAQIQFGCTFYQYHTLITEINISLTAKGTAYG